MDVLCKTRPADVVQGPRHRPGGRTRFAHQLGACGKYPLLLYGMGGSRTHSQHSCSIHHLFLLLNASVGPSISLFFSPGSRFRVGRTNRRRYKFCSRISHRPLYRERLFQASVSFRRPGSARRAGRLRCSIGHIHFLAAQSRKENLYFRFVVPLKHFQVIVKKTPNLKELVITGLSPSGNETFRQAVEDISRHNPDLERFYFAGQLEGHSVWNHRLSVPRELIACQNLRSLNICKIDVNTINRSLIEEMGRAWPHMRALGLQPESSWGDSPGVPPNYLEYFATSFPTLWILGISISFDGITSLPHPEYPVHFCELCYLDVRFSSISSEQIPLFAKYLASITTRTPVIMYSHDRSSTQAANWDRFQTLAQMEHRMRASIPSE